MPNWMPSLYPGGRARLILRRTSFNASRRSAGSAARYSVTVDAGMGQIYHEGFCHGNSAREIIRDTRKADRQNAVGLFLPRAAHLCVIKPRNSSCLTSQSEKKMELTSKSTTRTGAADNPSSSA